MTKDQIKGHLDKVTNRMVCGWATKEFNSEPCHVNLYIDQILVGSMKAAGSRPGLVEKGIHANGYCGFVFNLPNSLNNRKKYCIDVRIKEDSGEISLSNSPQVFQPLEWIDNLRQSFRKGQGEKILILGLPKSGTSALTYTLAESFNDVKIFFEPRGEEGLEDVEFHWNIGQLDQTVVTKCLFFNRHSSSLRDLGSFYTKKILIIRDPRDWLVSNFLYIWYSGHNMSPERFQKAIDLVKKKEKEPSSVNFYDLLELANDSDVFLRQYAGFCALVSDLDWSDCIHIKYEDLIDRNLSALGNYLNINVKKVTSVPANLKRVVRSQKYGDWRCWFTLQDVEYFRNRLNRMMGPVGYDTLDWKLTDKPMLNPKFGSEYMYNLFYGNLK